MNVNENYKIKSKLKVKRFERGSNRSLNYILSAIVLG